MSLLIPEVTLYVHPVDTVKHPDCQPGSWRWAVHVGGGGPTDFDRCVNARIVPSQQDAMYVGDLVAAGVCIALQNFGIPAGLRGLELPDDPVPAGPHPIRML